MIDEKESDERDQIGKNDEEILTDDLEVFKLVKFISERYIDNIYKEFDEINWTDIIDDKESYEIDEERLTDDIDFLKLRKWVSKTIETTLTKNKNKEIG